jgi:predicted ATP-dependent endonuclease of OLD family
MAEEFSNEAEAPGTEQPTGETRQAWEDVGHQFEQLGQSLATAFRTLWESEETQQNVESLRDGLQSMAADVSAAVNKSLTSEDTEKIKAEAQKAARSAQAATEKTAEEIRPQITNALKQVNEELQKLIERLEAEKDAD